jgi:hypothetical protein
VHVSFALKSIFMGDVLQVLREAKEKAERETQEVEDNKDARKAHFETLFDDYQGITKSEDVIRSLGILLQSKRKQLFICVCMSCVCVCLSGCM